ncbi:unnamed protein product [Amoebophrya sp. A25]|nr:unnamed protein product [Amoebophrya sp. A25]|eukprot:GSA25T00026588001.1
MMQTRCWLKELGVILHPFRPEKLDKFTFPTTSFDWIGFHINAVELLVTVQEEKRGKYVEFAREVLQSDRAGTLSAKALSRLAGRFCFVTVVLRIGRLYLRAIYDALSDCGAVKKWTAGFRRFDPIVKLSEHARIDIEWWVEALESTPTLRIYRTLGDKCCLFAPELVEHPTIIDRIPESLFLTFTGDAWSGKGWGVTTNDNETRFAGGFTFINGEQSSSNLRELALTLEFLTKYAHVARGKLLLYRTDNMTTRHYLNFGAGRNSLLSFYGRKIALQCAKLGCTLVAEHLRGKYNVVADMLSRLALNATNSDPLPHRFLLKRPRLALWARLRMTPTVDMLAANFGSSAALPRFVTIREDAFRWSDESLYQEISWWFPSNDLALPLLKKKIAPMMTLAEQQRPACIMLVPRYKSKHAYLYARFHRVAKLKKSGLLFGVMEKDGSFTNLPRSDIGMWVLATLPLEKLQLRQTHLASKGSAVPKS